MYNFPLEPDVRIQVDERLKNLGWMFDGINKNVFLEQPKTEEEKRKLNGKRPDYVLYEKGKDTPLIVIETKKRGANINSAIEQGKFYAETLNAPIVFATDGVYYKSLHTATQKPLLLNGEEVDELIRELTAIQYLQIGSNELDTIPKQVQLSRQALINIFNEANNTLRVEGLRAGIERFGEFSNILFLKLFSEIDDLKENPDFDRKWKWDFYKTKPTDEVLDYINNIVLPKISAHYNDSNILSPLQIKDGRVLKKIIDKLDPLVLTDINSDIKGDAFEYFLKSTTATGNDLGEYFTPRHIVKMMVKLANPQFGEKIYDPFCGTGGMLIESFRHIYNTMPRNEQNLEQLKKNTVFGNEITNTARITKMNMILAGDGHSNIEMKNSLANLEENKYDVVLTNMPYSQTTEYGGLYDIPTKNGDSICVQHCIKSINKTSDNGRIVMIVPEGFLFRKDLQKTREYMLNKCKLQSIISLPQGVFLPYTGVKTNVVYLTKVKQEETKNHFWYFDVKNDGYSLDNNRRKLEGESDVERFLANRKIDENSKTDSLSIGFNFIELEKVRNNDYILIGNRYKEFNNIQTKWDKIKLGEIGEFVNGYAFKPTDWKIEGKKIIRIQNLTKSNESYNYTDGSGIPEKYLVKYGDLLISWSATIGFYLWDDEEAYLNQHIFKVNVDNSKISKDYLYFLKNKVIKVIEKNVHGATMQHITKGTFENILIPLPPLDVQLQIVEELNGYQQIIDGAKMVVDNYKASFQIKPEWEVCDLSDVCSFEYGYTDVATNAGEIRFVRITDINNDGTLANNDSKYVTLSPENKRFLLKNNDLLVARIGATYGKTLLFNSNENAIFASYLIRLKLDKKVLPKYYLYFTQNEYYWEQARNLVTGGGQPQFNANTLKLIKLPIPPLEIQEQIISQIEAEQALVEPSKKLIEIFTKKITDKINQIWGE